MSLESALTISLSGIKASSTQLEMTASNISSASVKGYTKKTAVTTSVTLGSAAGGTEVTGFTRAQNVAMFTTLTNATSDASLRETQKTYLEKVQDLLGTSNGDDPRLSQYVTDFTNAWTDLAATPESLVNKRQVVQDATNIVDEVQRLSQQVEALDRECYTDIDSTLVDLNSYLSQIKDVNQKISLAINSNLSAGDLEDKRDQLVLKVSEIVGVKSLPRDSGQIALYTTSGYQLVDGASARAFSYDGTKISSLDNPDLSLNNALSGGSLDGLVSFRATTTPASTDPGTSVIQKLRSQLDAVVSAFTDTLSTSEPTTATIAKGIQFTSITLGNNISTSITAGTNPNTYMLTVTNGTTTETYDNLSDGLGPTHDLWSNMAAAIAARPSALVKAAIDGTNTTTTNTAAPTIATITNGIQFTSVATGTAASTLSTSITAGTLGGTYKLTVTNGTTTETYDNLSDGVAPAHDLWANMATALATAPSSLITGAVSGTSDLDPATLALPSVTTLGIPTTATLRNGVQYTSIPTGSAASNISTTITAGTNAGTYKLTVTNGTTTETYDNLSDGVAPAHDLWTNIAAALSAAPSALITATTDGTNTLNPASLTLPSVTALGVPVTATSLDPATLGLPTVTPLVGTPTFASAYNAATAKAGELTSSFFTGTNRTTFAVNADLVAGTSQVKTAAASGVNDAMLDSTRTFSADGLHVTGVSYIKLITSSFTVFQQAASNIGSLSDASESTRAYLEKKFSNETGVNVDDELVNLVTFQNAYAASAHAMSVIKELFTKLENLL